ncbi:MAG TPA: response regulator [Polyangiaceae bacterium]|jgi:CheY-like chemotaxis protein
MLARRLAPVPVAASRPETEKRDLSGVFAIPRITVMVVEPDDAQRAELSEALSVQFRVVDCTDAFQAAEVLGAIPAPDLIVCTVALPQVDGCSFARRLQTRAAFQRVPFIFLTREKNVDETLRALSAGARQCIEKPVKMPQLLEKVGRALAWAAPKN